MPRLRSTCTALIASDLCALLLSFLLAYLIRALAGGELVKLHYFGLLPGFPLFLLLYAATGLYPGVLRPPHDELKRLSIASSTGFLFLGFFFFLGQQGTLYSRLLMIIGWLLSLGLVPLFRFFTRKCFSGSSWWGYPVLLFAPEDKCEEAVREFRRHPEQGLYVAATVPLRQSSREDAPPASPAQLTLSDSEQVEAALRQLEAEYPRAMAFLVADTLPTESQQRLILSLGRHFRRVAVHLDVPWVRQASLQVADTPGGLVLSMRQNLLDPRRRRVKRLLDVCLCLLGGVFLLLLVPALALWVRLDSKGPAFFTQDRIGRDGRTIRIYKFRTMVANAEAVLAGVLARNPEMREEWTKDQKLTNDPRLTRAGVFLRRTSLDELPQIFNVLKGEMSLVGPRPIVRNEIARYGETYDLYTRVDPGITGLWQVSGRNDLDYAKRVDLDRYYVYNWSVWLDIYILIRTFPALLSRKGAY